MSGPESVGMPFEKLFATIDGEEESRCGFIFLDRWLVFTEAELAFDESENTPTSIAYGQGVSITYDSRLGKYSAGNGEDLMQVLPPDPFRETRTRDTTWEDVKRILEIMEEHHQFCLTHKGDLEVRQNNLIRSLRLVAEVFPSKFEGRENYSPRILAECPKCDRMVNVGTVLAEDDFNIAYDGTEAYEIDCPYCRALFEAKFAVEVVGTRLVKTDPGGE